jgi:hypothetical protein
VSKVAIAIIQAPNNSSNKKTNWQRPVNGFEVELTARFGYRSGLTSYAGN